MLLLFLSHLAIRGMPVLCRLLSLNLLVRKLEVVLDTCTANYLWCLTMQAAASSVYIAEAPL